jgi:hypothetical protein
MSIAAELESLRELHASLALSDDEFAKPKKAPLGGSRSNARGLAIASLACCCSAVLTGPLGGIAGLLLGILVLRDVKRSGNATGRGLAVAGVLLGAVILVANAILAVVFLYAMTHWRD